MSDIEHSAQWAGREHFTEYAEALGIDSDRIMAVGKVPDLPDRAMVLFTPQHDDVDYPRIFQVTVRRGADGVLHQYGAAQEIPDYWETLKAQVESDLQARWAKFGPPRKSQLPPDRPDDRNRYWGD